MKLHELFERKLLLEGVTLKEVTKLKGLKDPKTGEYYTGVVNVAGNVDLGNNNLTKLPVKFGIVNGLFSCSNNRLISLQGVPSSVDKGFYCSNNELTSLEGIHKIIKKIDGMMYLQDNPIETGGIGLILIEGLKEIGASQPAFKIINKYLGQGKKGVLLCQDELIEAGYEEYARL